MYLAKINYKNESVVQVLSSVIKDIIDTMIQEGAI